MPVAPRATHKVHMEVMPLFAGHLPFPDVRLFKYLPHHSAHSMQLDAGKAILTTWLLTEISLLFLCSCVKSKARNTLTRYGLGRIWTRYSQVSLLPSLTALMGALNLSCHLNL